MAIVLPPPYQVVVHHHVTLCIFFISAYASSLCQTVHCPMSCCSFSASQVVVHHPHVRLCVTPCQVLPAEASQLLHALLRCTPIKCPPSAPSCDPTAQILLLAECSCLYPPWSVILPVVATGCNYTPVQIAVSTSPGEADGAKTNPARVRCSWSDELSPQHIRSMWRGRLAVPAVTRLLPRPPGAFNRCQCHGDSADAPPRSHFSSRANGRQRAA